MARLLRYLLLIAQQVSVTMLGLNDILYPSAATPVVTMSFDRHPYTPYTAPKTYPCHSTILAINLTHRFMTTIAQCHRRSSPKLITRAIYSAACLFSSVPQASLIIHVRQLLQIASRKISLFNPYVPRDIQDHNPQECTPSHLSPQ